MNIAWRMPRRDAPTMPARRCGRRSRACSLRSKGWCRCSSASLYHSGAKHAASTRVFLDAVKRDAAIAQGAIGLVLDRPAIGSLLVDNLNASIHLRALLTDLFLIDQAISAKASSPSR